MEMTLEKFRELAERHRSSSERKSGPYSPAARAWAVEYARQSGQTAHGVARELGISDVTLRHWMRTTKASGTLRPVALTPAEPAETNAKRPTPQCTPALTLRTAQGHELGPLDVETAVFLLRALS